VSNPCGTLPNLNFAHLRRAPGGGGEQLPIGRKADCLHPLGKPDQPPFQRGAVRPPEQHLMEPGHREGLPVGRIVDRGDHRRRRVGRRMLLVKSLPGVLGRVVPGAFLDPALDQQAIRLEQGRLFHRHLGLPVDRRDQREQVALVRVPWRDCRLAVLFRLFAARDELGKVRHDVIALRLRGLVAFLAVRLEDRADLLEVADRLGRIDWLVLLWRRGVGGQHGTGKDQQNDTQGRHGGLGSQAREFPGDRKLSFSFRVGFIAQERAFGKVGARSYTSRSSARKMCLG
jgi:hypothetical protein